MVTNAKGAIEEQFAIYLCRLDPAEGSEMRKTRPCVVVSPEQLNRYLNTVLVAPLTSTVRSYVSRLNCRFQGRSGQICLDQIRCLDRSRLLKYLGHLDNATRITVSDRLVEVFS